MTTEDQDKLQAIKDKARREQAEKAQAEATARRASGRKKPETIGLGWIAAAVAVIAALAYIYTSKEPPKPGPLDNLEETAQKVAQYKEAAFTMAAVRELNARNIRIDDPAGITGSRVSINVFTARFHSDRQAYQLRGTYVCQSNDIMAVNRQNPSCYVWE